MSVYVDTSNRTNVSSRLVRDCERFLANNLDVEVASPVFELANKLQSSELRCIVTQFISYRFEAVSKTATSAHCHRKTKLS